MLNVNVVVLLSLPCVLAGSPEAALPSTNKVSSSWGTAVAARVCFGNILGSLTGIRLAIGCGKGVVRVLFLVLLLILIFKLAY